MDTAAASLIPLAAQGLAGWVLVPLDVALWLAYHWYWLVLALLMACAAGEWLVRRLAAKASQERMALELVPASHFDPAFEEIFRRGVELTRASTSLPWWAPRRSKSVRIRLRADGAHPLVYRVEGPAGAERLLRTTPFGPAVRTIRGAALRETPHEHEVRAEFVLRGNPVAELREVPLVPDPLQPLIDAVADVRAELGDLAEVCIDLQRAPKWALRARRFQVMQRARQDEQRETARTWRLMHQNSLRWGDSLLGELEQLTTRGGQPRGREMGRVLAPPAPERIDREEVLGKLAQDDHLVRVQILVRCASNVEGRAYARLSRIQAGFDVFGGSARWAMRGLRIGPWRLGADRWPHRRHFDSRWDTGQCRPPGANWVRLNELLGLLKPPTVHSRLPVLPIQLPTFEMGNRSLLLQGWYRSPDGQRRQVATHAEETLFALSLGKAGGGKTELALAQAIAYAHAGGGLLFIDPHHDSWQRGAPYLAHPAVAERIARIDLRGQGGGVSSWNPISMHHGRARHEVVEDVVDAFASAFGWDDASAPRALAIFTEALTVLTTINAAACRLQRFDDQATLFHLRPLLTDDAFRAEVLAAVADDLDSESRAWWHTVAPTLPPDAFTVILNPLGRLAANPMTRAFLGQGRGVYDIRSAMDHRMVVWICTAGSGPTDRLLVALIARDLLRAGRSRIDTPEAERVPFRGYLDEMITLAGSASGSLASMFEDFRKFRIHLHGMTQLLGRLPQSVQQSLVQNASTLATTRGSRAAVTPITEEWGGYPAPAHVAVLPQYHHYASFTVHGQRIGPIRIEGPHLDDVFADLARPGKVAALEAAADARAQVRPLNELTRQANEQLTRVRSLLSSLSSVSTASSSTSLIKQRDYQ
ncbi:ATP/GTP-binding protein [Streptomyces sp. NPDC048448]|uniref:ATP/GTP-binding protein n=1 Tax=Streptomyces sp. NPDC048448 TaxID=3365554 RepID=UPI00371BB49E